MVLHKQLSALVDDQIIEEGSKENDITIPGLSLSVEKALNTYGFDFFDRLTQYYGDKDEVSIQLGGIDVNMLDPVEKLRLLNDAYYKTRTLQEELATANDPTEPSNQVTTPAQPGNQGQGNQGQGQGND